MFDFVALIGGSHDGDAARARRLVRTAARVGCRGVALDLHRIEDVFAPEVLRVSADHRRRRLRELPRHQLPALAALARENGLRFGLSPCDRTSLDLAAEHADFLALTGYELPWLDLVLMAAETGLPLQLCTGMADAGEVWSAVETALEAGCTDLTLLHGVARFPVPPEACNLAALGTLREMLVREFAPLYPEAELKVGWADHSGHPGVVARAVNHWGCETAAIALDLDERSRHAAGHHWLPDRAAEIVAGGYLPVRRECDGSGRIAPDPGEMDERGWRADPADGLRPVRAVRRTWPGAQPGATCTGPDVYVVADGAGLDPLRRTVAVAECLRDDHDADVVFLVRGGDDQKRFLDRRGFNAIDFDELDDVTAQIGFLDRVTEDDRQPLCLLDVALPAGPLAASLRGMGAVTVVIGQPGCTEADLVLVPEFGWRPGPAGEDGGDDRTLGGSEYLLVDEAVQHWRGHADRAEAGVPFPRIVVRFDGGDVHGLALRAARALFELVPHGAVQVVVPPDTRRFDLVCGLLEGRFGSFGLVTTGDDDAPLLAGADLVLTNPGPTATAALCLGLPCLVLANGPGDADAARRLAAGGAVHDLGRQDELADDDLVDRLRAVLGDNDRLSRLRFHAQQLAAAPVDGHGASRVADRCLALLGPRA